MDKDRINEKLIYLNEVLYELNKLSKIKKKEFLKSNIYVSATENYLRKALQIIIDLATDIVSKNRLGPCSSYYEAFEILVNNDILSEKNLDLYKKMVGMRNKIVHDYERISKEVLYMVLENNLSDFDIAIKDLKKED